MSSIDWIGLKKDYIIGNYKSLSSFAEKKGLNINGNFKKKTKGWTDEKVLKGTEMSTKIINRTIERIIDREVDRNTKHLMVWDKILSKIDKLADKENIEVPTRDGIINIDVNHKHLAELATAMDKVQKGQRLAEGLDKDDKTNDTIAKSNERILRIAELLNSPVADRKIDDFEEE